MEGKVCCRCGERKSFSCFSRQKRMKDGHHSYCKSCFKNYQQENIDRIKEKNKFYQDKNKERIKKQNKCWRQENSKRLKEKSRKYYLKNQERLKEKARQYRLDNIEHKKKVDREYYKNNAERINNRVKAWVKENPESRRQIIWRGNVKRRSQKHNVEFTKVERKRILDRDAWTCQNCGIKVHDRSKGDWNTPDKAHIDHIIPISKGGHSKPSNLRTLCRTCNLTKLNRVDEQLKLQL